MKTKLLSLSIPVLFALIACDSAKKPDASGGPTRGEVVAASAAVQTVETKKPEAHVDAKPATKRKLCDKAPAQKGKRLDGANVDRIGNAKSLDCAGKMGVEACNRKPIATKPNTVTWVNAWAGWCAPCKEEIPRLLSWEKKLQAAGKKFEIAFVSVDDDLRQAEAFFTTAPAGGLKGSYHLADGEPRTTFFTRFGVKADPELPIHLIFDGKGELSCVVEGAIDDGDYAEVERIASGL